MNKKALIIGVIWTVIAIGGINFLINGINKKTDFKGEKKIMKKFEERNTEIEEFTGISEAQNIFDAEELSLIKVECHSASLVYTLSDDNKIHVDAIGNWKTQKLPKVECTDGKLYVKTQRQHFIFFPGFGRREIHIAIPVHCLGNDTEIFSSSASGSTKMKDYKAKKIRLQSASGSIYIKDSMAEEFQVEAASGSTKIEGSNFGYVNISSASGSVYLNGSFEQLNIENASGSIKIENDIPLTKDSSIEAVSGSVSLKLPEESDYKLNYESVTGSFRDELTGTSGGRKGSEIKGKGSVQLNISTVSGSIKISKN